MARCECCKRLRPSVHRVALDIFRVVRGADGIDKATERIDAMLCGNCREHTAGECPKCFVEGQPLIVTWQCAWVAHAGQFHPGLVAVREDMPAEKPVEPRLKHIGRLYIP